MKSIVWLIVLGGVANVFAQAWLFMLLIGMLHIHVLSAVRPIGFDVALEFAILFVVIQSVLSMVVYMRRD